MKQQFLLLICILLSSANGLAHNVELGFGDFYTIRYSGNEYSTTLITQNHVYKNAGFVGRGIAFDRVYLGMVVGLTDTKKINSGGLDFSAGVEASLSIPIDSEYSIRIESIQTPKFQMETILFGYAF